MLTSHSTSFFRQKGFSLVELMVSLVLGGLIIAAVGTVYLGSRQSFRTQDAMSRMQEGARYAFETMSVDLRQVGFGCASVNTDALDADPNNWYRNVFKRPLFGFEDGAGLASSTTATGAIANTDALLVLRADKSRESQLASATTTVTPHGMTDGGWIVVSEVYSDATAYQATTASGSNVALNAASALPCRPGAPVAAATNFMLLPLAGHVYYIRNNPAGEPSLYRETLRADGTTEAQELVEGIEDMQILYGVDNTQLTLPECPDDRCSANVYWDADQVTAANLWNRVVAVRVTLDMRSPETRVSTSGDGRLRKPFTTTIAVRNRL
ncbi:MAG: prepilin-type N-terminal cleavage/methylation domain-containing protein [Thiobacillus sp.]|nr:prepilin-type N-terminal cleavage/methylation domain-containing protein [Thiobacillus sp.]